MCGVDDIISLIYTHGTVEAGLTDTLFNQLTVIFSVFSPVFLNFRGSSSQTCCLLCFHPTINHCFYLSSIATSSKSQLWWQPTVLTVLWLTWASTNCKQFSHDIQVNKQCVSKLRVSPICLIEKFIVVITSILQLMKLSIANFIYLPWNYWVDLLFLTENVPWLIISICISVLESFLFMYIEIKSEMTSLCYELYGFIQLS